MVPSLDSFNEIAWQALAWLALAALLTLMSARGSLRALRRPLNHLARRPDYAITTVALLSLALAIGLCLLARFPIAWVHDEQSYLLAADTFASGRLNNPPHPLWEFFESFHVLQQPRYMSKYPPGQGLALALGQVLTGLPIVGAWISTAAACAAVAWCLYGWAPARWALVGGLLTALHPVVVDWSYTYWGGSVAMLGGALVGGALPRLMRRPAWRHGLWFGIGLAIMAYSRPFEGAIFGLLCSGALVIATLRRQTAARSVVLLKALVPGAAVLAAAMGWLMWYNAAATGSPLTMPYELYEKQYAVVMPFEWQPLEPDPEYRHAAFRDFNRLLAYERFGRPSRQTLLSRAGDRYEVLVAFLFRPNLSAVLLLTIPWALWKVRRARVALVIFVLFALLAVPPVNWMRPQYVAPVGGFFALAMICGLRLLSSVRLRTLRLGQGLAAGLVLVMLWTVAHWYWEHIRYYPIGFYSFRSGIEEVLKAHQGRDVVVVHYGPKHNAQREWVYNRADIDNAEIIWARNMGPEKNQALIEYFKDRTAWLVEADDDPPVLRPYPASP